MAEVRNAGQGSSTARGFAAGPGWVLAVTAKAGDVFGASSRFLLSLANRGALGSSSLSCTNQSKTRFCHPQSGVYQNIPPNWNRRFHDFEGGFCLPGLGKMEVSGFTEHFSCPFLLVSLSPAVRSSSQNAGPFRLGLSPLQPQTGRCDDVFSEKSFLRLGTSTWPMGF